MKVCLKCGMLEHRDLILWMGGSVGMLEIANLSLDEPTLEAHILSSGDNNKGRSNVAEQ